MDLFFTQTVYRMGAINCHRVTFNRGTKLNKIRTKHVTSSPTFRTPIAPPIMKLSDLKTRLILLYK